MAKKGVKMLIKLRNPETGTFYTTYRNPKSPNTTENYLSESMIKKLVNTKFLLKIKFNFCISFLL